MEEIKTFINEFLKAEVLAADASVKPNLEDYNNKLDFMNRFCVEELYNKFGMLPHTELDDEEFYERWKDADPESPRHLYKISLYKEDTYGDVYAVYLSARDPNDVIFTYGECVFVTKIKNELKIVKSYAFGSEMKTKKNFNIGLGVEDISFKTFKKPVAIERYMEPEDDDDAMEHYNKDI